ncbi:unnamed protein product [Adineta steineri]|uniref:Uncharacterized protein n=1 Tax=Adineta steineri TaxID=433720 RepID=A0A820M7G9_9BILA|nr:unnamed protein product [Adineta steineri]
MSFTMCYIVTSFNSISLFDNVLQVIGIGMAHQISGDLQDDIEHIFNMNKDKEVQQIVIQTRENTSKEYFKDETLQQGR